MRQRTARRDGPPHFLRHSVAVHMAEAGIDREEIAQFLGHSTPAITRKVYARFSPNYLRKAAEVPGYDDMGSMNLRTTSRRKLKAQ